MSDELPEGWVSRPLPDILTINPPKPTADALPAATAVSFVPMPAVNAARGVIDGAMEKPFGEVRKAYTAFADGDVLLAKITPCFENGKAAVASGLKNGLGFGSSEFFVLRPHGAVLPKYVFHFVRQQSFRDEGAEKMNGAVGQARVPADFLRSIELPVPPLAEQKRIVEKIEALLADVNRARDRLANVPGILKRFRQAVLAAACSGRLTEEWRGTNRREPAAACLTRVLGMLPTSEPDSSLPDTWAWVSLGALVTSLRMGTTVPPGNEATQYPVLRSSSVRSGAVDLDDVKYLAAADSRNPENFINEGDLLFTRLSGSLEYVANCAVVGDVGNRRVQYPDRLFRAQLRDPSWGPYVEACFGSPPLRKSLAIASKSSAGHQRISMGALTEFRIPFPPTAEQAEILHVMRSLLAVADDIERRVAQASAQVDKLPQTILSRAFSGELVPTEAELARVERREFEPATALLQRLTLSKPQHPQASRRGRGLATPRGARS